MPYLAAAAVIFSCPLYRIIVYRTCFDTCLASFIIVHDRSSLSLADHQIAILSSYELLPRSIVLIELAPRYSLETRCYCSIIVVMM
jgi:hypothetical protein